MEELDLQPGPPISHARNIWRLSFYFAGMRTSDVLRLRWSDFQNDRLNYTMGKNNKPGSVKIPEREQSSWLTISRWLTKSTWFFLTCALSRILTTSMKSNGKWLNDYLKRIAMLAGIDRDLSMHMFGNIAGDKIPVQMLQKLYQHSSILTTIDYQANFMQKQSNYIINL